MTKYPGGVSRQKDLVRSLAIFTAMIVAAHLIEIFVSSHWLALLIIYPPAVWMFYRYRKFNIFRSCLISKIAARLAQFEPNEWDDSASSFLSHEHPQH